MVRKSPKSTRPSRYKVPNNEKILLAVGNERFAGTLHVLSATGGTMRVPKRPSPGTFADIKISTVSGTISAVVEMLSQRGDSAQAFRFVQIDGPSKKRLHESLEAMEKDGLGDRRAAPMTHVMRFARKLLPGH